MTRVYCILIELAKSREMHPYRAGLYFLGGETVQHRMGLQVLSQQSQQYSLEIFTVWSCENLLYLGTAYVVFEVYVEAQKPRVEFLLGNIQIQPFDVFLDGMVKGFHLKGILEEYSKDVGQDIATLLLYWFFPHFAISFPFFVYPQTDTFFSFFLLLLVLTLQNDGPIPSCDELLVDRYRKTCFTESFKRKAWRSIYIVKDKVAF